MRADDAIVDVENVFRRLKENKGLAQPLPTLQVVYNASSEVRNSIVFATIIVVLVFLPLFYMSGIEGRLFIPLGVAYIVSLLASLFVSLTITPVLCSLLLSKDKLIEHEDGRLVKTLKKWDRKLLTKSLDHPNIVFGVTIALFLGSLALIPFMGRDFLPKFNEGTATVNIMATPGISLEESNKLGTQAEELLLSTPEVKKMAQKMVSDQKEEIAQMQKWREQFYTSTPKDNSKLAKMDMSSLKEKSGKAFDLAFLDLMAKHHEQGISMAKSASDKLFNSQIKTFAQNAIMNQGKEVQDLSQMKKQEERK